MAVLAAYERLSLPIWYPCSAQRTSLRRTNVRVASGTNQSSRFHDASPQKLIAALGGGSSGGDGLEKVQRLIGRANGEDKRIGFGPPPPSDADAGAGFVNLLGRDEIMSGIRKFSEPSPLGRSGKSSPVKLPVQVTKSGGTEASGETDSVEEARGTEGHNQVVGVDSGRGDFQSFLLPSPLTVGQKVMALGLLGLTVVAFGKGSQDLLPENVISFLQGWMLLAWGGHAALGFVAAAQAPGKEQSSIKWFIKIVASGALGFDEFLKLPATN